VAIEFPRRLLTLTILVELIALGVFFAFFLGATTAQGGRIKIDMTQFGEMWLEYIIMCVLVACAPYALYSAERYLE